MGAQQAYRINAPRIICSSPEGSATPRLPPMVPPIRTPAEKNAICSRATRYHMIMFRERLVPNWIAPCSGITAVGGKTVAMTPSINTPPPSPATMPNAAVKKARITNPANKCGVTPGTVDRNSVTRGSDWMHLD